MYGIRKPAVAGLFYPSQKEELEAILARFVEKKDREKFPKALIVPHAGYIYSGKTAGRAYSLLSGHPGIPAVIGPSHHFLFRGIVSAGFSLWETPLGTIREMKFPSHPKPEFFLPEHSVEVQVPFLQFIGIREFSPVLTGVSGRKEWKRLLKWRGPIIISSDFSHYHPLEEAREIDEKSHETIINLDPDGFLDACGEEGIRMLLELAKRKGWEAELVDYSTSYDISGDASSVVGYRSYAFWGD